jgi:tetratricopeptide (TPR) repeat protein
VWRELDDKRELANALYNASFSFIVTNDPTQIENLDRDGVGRRRMTEARDLYEELGDDAGVGNALWALGNRAYFSKGGDLGEALFKEALERFQRAGDRTMEAWARHQLGSALLRLGRPDEARGLLSEALEHFSAVGDAAGLSLVLDDLSALAVVDGDLAGAARLHGAARNLSNTSGATLAAFVDEVFEGGFRPHARHAMSGEELERLAAEGAAMSLDDAVAYARATLTADSTPAHADLSGR